MIEENKQRYIGSLAFFTSCLIVCFIIFLIHVFVHDELDTEYILANFTPSIDNFLAENAEKYSYMLSVIFFPVIFFLLYVLFKKRINNFSEKKLKIIILSEIILGIISVPLFTMFSDVTKKLYFINYISPIIAIFALIFFIFLFYIYEKKNKFNWIITTLIAIAVIFYTYQVFSIYNTPTYDTSERDILHFEAYFYPIYKTISGLTPGIDFKNLYGFYPYIYSLFFNLDNISIQKISLFNAILSASIFLLLAYILFTNIKNKVLAFLIYNVCTIYSLFAIVNTQISRKGIYYLQYFPHRVFFAMLICALITFYLHQKNEKVKKIVEYLGYIISSIAIFWNFESGIAVLAGWSSLDFYLSLNKPQRCKKILIVYLKAFLSIFIAFFAIFIITYIHSSQIINPLGLFFGQFVFFAKGFYLKKMNIIEQPFMLVLIVYFIALSEAVKAIIENKITQTDILKFTFSVVGFGLFTYFQGRSHVICLIACSWPVYIILGLMMENYFYQYKNNCPSKFRDKPEGCERNLRVVTLKSEHYDGGDDTAAECETGLDEIKFIAVSNLIKFSLLYIFASLITVSCINCMISMPNNVKYIGEVVLKNSTQIKNLQLLKPNEEYDFLTQDSSFYYIYLQQPNLKPFSEIFDCFLKEDLINIDNYLKTSNKKLVIDNITFQTISPEYINQYYKLADTNGNIYIFEKK